MDCSQVLRRLSEIEQAIGVLDSISVRRMVMEAQDYILQSQKEAAQIVRLNEQRSVVNG